MLLSSLSRRAQGWVIPKYRYPHAKYIAVVALVVLFATIGGKYAGRFREGMWDVVLRRAGITDTQYASTFSWASFQSIKFGDNADVVMASLGKPFLKTYRFAYQMRFENVVPHHHLDFDFDANGVVVGRHVWPNDVRLPDSICALTNETDVRAAYGAPFSRYEPDTEDWWFYTRSPSSTYYWQCIVVVDVKTDKVIDTKSQFYFD